jgi:hypothetical protein
MVVILVFAIVQQVPNCCSNSRVGKGNDGVNVLNLEKIVSVNLLKNTKLVPYQKSILIEASWE